MYQIAALGVTLVLSISGGLLAGLIVSTCCTLDHYFDDEEHMRDVKFDIELQDMSDDEKEKPEFDNPPRPASTVN